jgi:hypothetical protein
MSFLRNGEAKIACPARLEAARPAGSEVARSEGAGFGRLRATRLLLSRFTRMNILAYVAIVRVVITERLWRVPARAQTAAASGRVAPVGAGS